jgi:CHAD domain-containing protein
MGYHFKRKESHSKAVRRLVAKRVAHALECLAQSDGPRGVHGARKEVKKVRAIVRLFSKRISRKQFRRLKRWLSDAAALLAPLRDATIKVQALDELAKHFEGRFTPAALRRTRAMLRQASQTEMKRFDQQHSARAVTRLFRKIAGETRQVEVKGRRWKALESGVKRSYRAGRRALREVRESPAAANFHEWRKRTKDLGYHVKLLNRIWPEQMDAMASELNALTQYLGDGHDLVVLEETLIRDAGDNRVAAEFELIQSLIRQREQELRKAALELGTRFYGERPAEFSHRLSAYWHAWQQRRQIGRRTSEGGGLKSEVRSQKSEVRGRKSEVESQDSTRHR